MELGKALATAKIIKQLLEPHCIKVEIGGSIRRQRKEVKDIEIICIPKTKGESKIRDNKWVMAVFKLGKIRKGKLKDGKYLQIALPTGINLDLFIASPENWGMIYLIRTGAAQFSKYILTQFNKRGYKSEGGYPVAQYGEAKGTKLQFETERQVFDFLRIKYVEPVERM